MYRMSLYFSIWLLCNKPVLCIGCPCTSVSDCSVINRFYIQDVPVQKEQRECLPFPLEYPPEPDLGSAQCTDGFNHIDTGYGGHEVGYGGHGYGGHEVGYGDHEVDYGDIAGYPVRQGYSGTGQQICIKTIHTQYYNKAAMYFEHMQFYACHTLVCPQHTAVSKFFFYYFAFILKIFIC